MCRKYAKMCFPKKETDAPGDPDSALLVEATSNPIRIRPFEQIGHPPLRAGNLFLHVLKIVAGIDVPFS